jgi:hypothetical protein
MSAGVHQDRILHLLLPYLTSELSASVHHCSPSWLSVWLSQRFLIPTVLEIAAACSIAFRLIPAADEFSRCHGEESRSVPF